MKWIVEFHSPGLRQRLAWQALLDAWGNGLALGITTLYLVGPGNIPLSKAGAMVAMSGVAGFLATMPAGRLAARLGARRFLVLSGLLRGLLYVCLALADSRWATGALIVAMGAAEAGAYSVFQVLFDEIGLGRVRADLLGARRAIVNVGFLCAAPVVGMVVAAATRMAYSAGFLLNAATFFVSAWLLARLPSPGERPLPVGASRRALILDGRYLALALMAAVFGMSMLIFEIALPLWIAKCAHAPRWAVGACLAVNAVLVLMFQQRVARSAKTLDAARAAVVRSAACLAGGCLLIALHASASGIASIVLVGGVILVTAGEMLESAAWWTISYALANPARRTEYLAMFDLGFPLLRVAGPPVAILVVSMGSMGWAICAAAFLAAGFGTQSLIMARTSVRRAQQASGE